jgi:hypothetical protein
MVACSRGRYPPPQAWALQPLGTEGLLAAGARCSQLNNGRTTEGYGVGEAVAEDCTDPMEPPGGKVGELVGGVVSVVSNVGVAVGALRPLVVLRKAYQRPEPVARGGVL